MTGAITTRASRISRVCEFVGDGLVRGLWAEWKGKVDELYGSGCRCCFDLLCGGFDLAWVSHPLPESVC